VEIGLRLIETSSVYSGNISHYQASCLSSLGSIFEALSGIFCEMARCQGVRDMKKSSYDRFTENIHTRNPLFSAKRYLQECLRLLALKNKDMYQKAPFTAMSARAQTFAFEIANVIVDRGGAQTSAKPSTPK
jgi:hypothetical protein